MSSGRQIRSRRAPHDGIGCGVRSLDEARVALARYQPRLLTRGRRAAVAVVLHEGPAGAEMLFIERARRLGDPWSGHMAFPGGRVDPTDADERAAAERETLEEVGVDLARVELLGRLDDVAGGIALLAPLVLSAFVYRVPTRPTLCLNGEVADALWVPVATLLDPGSSTGYGFGPFRLPGICVGDPNRNVVWGLTLRILDSFLEIVGA